MVNFCRAVEIFVAPGERGQATERWLAYGAGVCSINHDFDRAASRRCLYQHRYGWVKKRLDLIDVVVMTWALLIGGFIAQFFVWVIADDARRRRGDREAERLKREWKL